MENWKALSPMRLIAMDPGEVPSYLGSGKEGLTAREAESRLRSVGRNEIASGRLPSLLSRALLLFAAAVFPTDAGIKKVVRYRAMRADRTGGEKKGAG